jgi:rare lipoprotein A
MRAPLLILLFLNIFRCDAQMLVETGIASYYSDKFVGRKCTSGEIFKQESLTAAHKTLKFGTMVRVTNLKNDSCVIVKINDRMPKSSKRSIDLTKKAARQLNFISKGLTRVKIEVLKDSLP